MPDTYIPTPSAPLTALDWALYYARRGWSVVPVRRGEKIPAVPWARHQSAPANEALIRSWFDHDATLGVGLVQGRHVGTVVLDFDGELGMETLARLDAQGLPAGIRQFTPRGGVHVMLQHPGVHIATRKNVLPGMDVRGDGGFIVAAPSLGSNSRQYAWDCDAHPEDAPLADVPDWLLPTLVGPVVAAPAEAPITRASVGTGPFDFGQERVTDGREQYMRDTILAVLRDMRDRLGRLPTEAELIGEAWPQYEAKVDFTRPGRGASEFAAKARYTLQRAERGMIRGLLPAEPAKALNGEAFDPETGELPPRPEAKAERPTRSIRLLTMGEVEALPPPQWLIHGVLPRAGLVIPYGPPKAGKTFIVLSMALHVAAGLEWFGKHVTQGAVVYVVGEGLGGFAARLTVMREAYGIPADAPFYVVPRAVNFRDEKVVAELCTAIEAALPPGVTLALIVIDTLARAMPGVDENSAQEVGLVIAKCDAVKEHFGCTVAPVHHTGKDVERGMRGSNALLGAVDASYLIQRAGKGVARLKNDAMKDAEEHPDMLFDMEQVMVGLRSSLVPRLRDAPRPGRPEDPEKPSAQELRMRALIVLTNAKLDDMRFADIARAIGLPNGRAQAELRDAIPLGIEHAVRVGAYLMWKSAQGTSKTAPLMVHRRLENEE